MRQYQETEETERLEFARKAAKHFEENPLSVTFSKNGPENGEFMALRWGGGNDCVVVFRVHEYEDIINYAQFISREAANKSIDANRAAKNYLKEKELDRGEIT